MFTRYILPGIALIALGFAVVQMTKAQQKPSPLTPPVDPGRSPYGKQLAGAGIVEPETENISIGSHVPGVVAKLYVKVGQKVKPGDRLFQLDDRQLQAELMVRRSIHANATATFEKLKQQPRLEERPTQDAKIVEAEVNLKNQQKLYDRVKNLTGSAVSEEEVTTRQLAVELSKAQLAKAKGDYALWNAGAWKPDLDIAQATIDQALAQMKQTEIELQRITMTAPHQRWKTNDKGEDIPDDEGVAFEVLQVNIRPGEYVANTPGSALIVLGYVGKLHVRVDLDENDIARFRTNFSGLAKLRGNPDVEFPLTFVRVEPYVIPKKSLTGANTERVDTRVLQVIYAIDTKGMQLYVGQQMDVFLNASH
jgi:multidrug efflux pump subunit AcrA (membrane-fusion protein)